MFIQMSVIAGCAAVGLTLWFALTQYHLDFAQASLRAVGVGLAIMGFSLLISGVIEKLGGPSN
jgi:predicted phage tail protein